VARLGIHVFRTRQDIWQWAGFAVTAGLCFLLRGNFPMNHWLSLLAIGCAITFSYGVFLLFTDGFLPEELKLLSNLKTRVMG
jgi:hypothetical protein